METIKEEKKADLEQLLNSLIEKGWRPFRKTPVNINQWNSSQTYCTYFDKHCIQIHREDVRRLRKTDEFRLRELVSKESGLWQFVCENNLNYSEDDSIYNVWLKHYAEDDHESPYTYASPVWYLIESALKDESELEEFLLNSIKID